ncbi:MAG: hypothetical protein K0V04_09490 [Deltaproteobacteria bacterium]|nr:hypothetical protein [Deltaproteobacteria bacterium]
MIALSRVALALALSVALPALGGCSPSTELRRVRTPRSGADVAYKLDAGQGYDGQLRVGNTRAVAGLDQPLSQTATCELNMVVLGETPLGTEVRVTITSVDLDWDLPPSATYSSQELLELANDQLRGMQVRFTVRPDGRVHALPDAPANAPPELREVIETLLLGMEAFFVPTPADGLRRGQRWDESFSHEVRGLTQQVDHHVELEGMFEHRTDETRLARLRIGQDRREQRHSEPDPQTVEREIRGQMMFSVDGYPLELDRETQEFDPEYGMVFRKVRATWTRARGLVPEMMAPGTDVQVINDPCNPDYVGPKPCLERSLTAPTASDDDGGADSRDDEAASKQPDAQDDDAATTSEADAAPKASTDASSDASSDDEAKADTATPTDPPAGSDAKPPVSSGRRP